MFRFHRKRALDPKEVSATASVNYIDDGGNAAHRYEFP